MQSTKLNITYLNQEKAKQVDIDLMTKMGFSLDILMELAGQSVAHSIYHADKNYHQQKLDKVLFICGVGNNGGDGLVAARHLNMLGKKTEILIFREPKTEHFRNLQLTCELNGIQTNMFSNLFSNQDKQREEILQYLQQFDMIVDGIFGFSFKPPVREPYDKILDGFKEIKNKVPIFSIDIPSGWDVEKGNIDKQYFEPDYLISLTLPKLGVQQFNGTHYLGGRFVPKKMVEENQWDIPEYEQDKQYILLNSGYQ